MKRDVFGEVTLHGGEDAPYVDRDTCRARPWARWLARRLLTREARALAAIEGIAGIPEVLQVDSVSLQRSWIPGDTMHTARPTDVAYFNAAARLLRRLHRHGLVHNDLAKETNWLVTDEGKPGIVDFQLAWYTRKRGRLFRILAHEDLRHLLKHKRSYCPQHLTRRERAILASPSIPSRAWMTIVKSLYLFVTRKILRWDDRKGSIERTDY